MKTCKKLGLIIVTGLLFAFTVVGLFPRNIEAALPTRYFNNLVANGTLVVDGQEDAVQVRAQGYTTQTSNLVIVEQSDGDDKVTVSNAGAIVVTTDAGTDLVNVQTGSFKVGNATPNQTLNGEDGFVEGTLEISGTSYLQAATIAGTVNMSNNPVTNIGVAGTDFGADGSLTTAQTVTVSAGDVSVVTGNLVVGNGTPDLTQNGEDGYINGTFEVDGATRIDGTTEINGNVDADSISVAGNSDLTTINNSSGAITVNDNVAVAGVADAVQLAVTGYTTQTSNLVIVEQSDGDDRLTVSNAGAVALTQDAGTDLVNVLTGSLKIGNGSPSVAQDGEDGYVEGQLEVDGEAQFDGAIDANSTSGFAGNATFDAFQISTSQSITPTDGGVITPTAGIVLLTPAGEVTPTIAACTGGEHLILYNQENQSINLADSGNLIATGALVLTQYDTLPLVCVATKWVQVGPVSVN